MLAGINSFLKGFECTIKYKNEKYFFFIQVHRFGKIKSLISIEQQPEFEVLWR
jgi:hypothetical protein